MQMKIFEAFALSEREVVSFVGGGGKTTLMFRLAGEIPLGRNVIVTTTTKIYPPASACFPVVFWKEGLEKELAEHFKSGLKPVVASGLLKDNKLKGINAGQVSVLQNHAEYVLVEADGSRGFSLKGHMGYEPVIPGSTTILIVVIGADVLGKNLNGNNVHRPEIVSCLTGREIGSRIDAEMIAELITHPAGILRDCPSWARVVPFINKTDRLKDPGEGYRLGSLLLGEKIKKVVLGSAIAENPVLDIITG